MTSVTWMRRAACRGLSIELFFGPDGERQAEREVREAKAKRICHRCPVTHDCLIYAQDIKASAGVWAGLNDDERKTARRRWLRKRSA